MNRVAPKVGDVRWVALTAPMIITSVTPILTKYSHADQTTRIEGYTVGERAMTREEVVAFTVAGGGCL